MKRTRTESLPAPGTTRTIADGVVQVALPLPGKPTIINVYLIDLLNDEWALVDTGTAHQNSLDAFAGALQKEGM